jgi:hypothetical protein
VARFGIDYLVKRINSPVIYGTTECKSWEAVRATSLPEDSRETASARGRLSFRFFFLLRVGFALLLAVHTRQTRSRLILFVVIPSRIIPSDFVPMAMDGWSSYSILLLIGVPRSFTWGWGDG